MLTAYLNGLNLMHLLLEDLLTILDQYSRHMIEQESYVQFVVEEDYTAQDGQLFSAGGWQGLTTDNAIANTDDDTLYQTQLTQIGWLALHGAGVLGDLTLEAGESYQVDYHFAEIEHIKSGQRVIDVHSEGELRANALDVYSKVGADAAYIHSVFFTAGDTLYNTGMQTNGAASWDPKTSIAAFSIRLLDVAAWEDADNDGVFNFDDKCADTPADSTVDEKGCQLP